MRAAWLVVAACVCLSVCPGAQTLGSLVQDGTSFEAAMLRTGDAWEIVSRAVEGPSYLLNSVRGDGLTRLDLVRENLAGIRAFLLGRERHEAARLVDEALAAVADLRLEFAMAVPDQAAASGLSAEVTSACVACHARYRDGNAVQGFRPRPGLLD